MKLYSNPLSPFAVRVRVSIYARELPIEIVDVPQGGNKSPEYLAVNPLGKIPALQLDDETGLPESEVIVEYLEEVFPQKSLLPADPVQRARVRVIGRAAELYVMAAIGPLFGQMDPSTRDQAVVETQLAKLREALTSLEPLMGPGPYGFGGELTLADGILFPVLTYVGVVGQAFGAGDLLAAHPKLAAYLPAAGQNPVLARVHGEIMQGLAAMRGG